ncbi:4Fe-4S binding protein [Adhaeribacter aquaticus]|uniref:4Fe-4S binding protein n=1 Tax=Adhaeribacter aquaticus TaxID=299567 RepID=UPI00040BADC8|nr:4Fe-4S binding protein [Adhaeribacter aquaticus]
MSNHQESLSIGYNYQDETDTIQKAALALFAVGLLLLVLPLFSFNPEVNTFFLWGGTTLSTLALLLYFFRTYQKSHPGVRNNGVWLRGSTSRGKIAWVTAVVLTGFYIILYWFPQYLGNLIEALNPTSQWLRGKPADHWFLYGSFYTLAILVMGVRAILKYRHSPYQIIRTISVMLFQFLFAYLIPAFLMLLNEPEFYFSYFWPLKYDYLFPGTLGYLAKEPGALGVFMVFWSVIISLIGVPILTYFFGKRWYCSWVCGCGGLAETAGDPYRQLSDKSRKAWKYEVAIIYPILGFIVLTTLLLWLNSMLGGWILGSLSNGFSQAYGFFIGAIFSGVIGVGFYPIMGSRVWCRFGCPMAAYLGLLQKHFSRFRITTNGGQCISCGNCSTYCEMGIDVRWYAQQGKPIIRASCVGCGMCATVCPRGVLNLETGPQEGRYMPTNLISPENIRILN